MSAIILVVLAAAVACLDFWFVKNANKLLIDLVEQNSDGKLKLQLSKATFDIFKDEVHIHKAKISSTAKNKNSVTYNVGFREAVLHTNSLWSFLIDKSPQIKGLELYDPVIEVFNHNRDSRSTDFKSLSLTLEMGKIYNSIQDAVSSLDTRSISIFNAKLILHNEASETRAPLAFSNLYFSLKRHDNPANPTGNIIENSDISFSSTDQDIMLTDGIHKLKFRSLSIHQARNLILDSCTITASSAGASGNSFDIFFKRLALKGVDFNALYSNGLIKADSVYCISPSSDFVFNSDTTAKSSGPKIPDFKRILQEFSGNLQLNFLGVFNAGLHFSINGNNKLTNIKAGNLNFQITDLRVNPDSAKIVSIGTFDLTIKGYQLYNGDSSVIYSFDGVQFANNQLLLNNFSMHTAPGANKMRSFRDYRMRYFELLGVEWSDLFFHQNLKATEAILHDPVLNYRKAEHVDISKKAILFNSNHTFDDFMEIEKLKIINGKINITWSDNNALQLEDIDASLFADNITDYKHVKLQKDVQSISFRSGYLRLGEITAQLRDVSFNSGDDIQLGEVIVKNKQEEISSRISHVSIKNIYNTSENNFVVEGLGWDNGEISIQSLPRMQTGNGKTSFQLKDISGRQTQFKFSNEKNELNAFVEELHVSNFERNNARQNFLTGFSIAGKEMNGVAASSKFHASGFSLSDRYQKFSGVTFSNSGEGGVANVAMSLMEMSGDFNNLFKDDRHLDYVLIKTPVIDFQKNQEAFLKSTEANFSIPKIRIDHILLENPVLHLSFIKDGMANTISFPEPKEATMKIDSLQLSPGQITIGDIIVKTQNAEISKGDDTLLKVDNGLDIEISKVSIPSDESVAWSAMIDKISLNNKQGFTFPLKQNKILLHDMYIGDYLVSAKTIKDPRSLFQTNSSAWFRTSYARYTTEKSIIQGFKVKYNFDGKIMTLDSVNYNPTLSATETSVNYPKQANYTTFSLGGGTLQGFDLGKFIGRDSLVIRKAVLTRPSINVLRLKFPTSQRKKMFIEQINSISIPVAIDEIIVDDGKVNYLEKNEKTRLEAKVYLTHLNGNISHINNFSRKQRDSLSINFNGQLLDAAPFDISISQSYTDSLYGFVMDLQIQPTSLSILNPLLTPLSSVKFSSGSLDQLKMHAVGNENFAYGKMDFYYRGLKIQLLKNDVFTQPTFFKKVESALVNAFLLKTENNDRMGLIYFRRLKSRSFFNYMNKIILSGVSTSTGVKRNKRFQKNILRDKVGFK
ncbi:MAG: hypothetical protein ABIO82_06965 [Ginsengibacter sp.]